MQQTLRNRKADPSVVSHAHDSQHEKTLFHTKEDKKVALICALMTATLVVAYTLFFRQSNTHRLPKPNLCELSDVADTPLMYNSQPFPDNWTQDPFFLSLQQERAKERFLEVTNLTEQCVSENLMNERKFAEKTRVAIIVPFRDAKDSSTLGLTRTDQLNLFVELLPKLLNSVHAEFHIFIAEQSNDTKKFNPGKLRNIGFDLARRTGQYDNYIFHDIDLIPDCQLLEHYLKYPKAPHHLANCGTRYTNEKKGCISGESFIGGVIAFNKEQFEATNGYPSDFWGWGSEDDELLSRIEDMKYHVITAKPGCVMDIEALNVKQKMDIIGTQNSINDKRRAAREKHAQTWKTDGLNSLTYFIQEVTHLNPHASKYTVLV